MKKVKPKGTCSDCDKRMTHRCDNWKAEKAYLSDSSWCGGFAQRRRKTSE